MIKLKETEEKFCIIVATMLILISSIDILVCELKRQHESMWHTFQYYTHLYDDKIFIIGQGLCATFLYSDNLSYVFSTSQFTIWINQLF